MPAKESFDGKKILVASRRVDKSLNRLFSSIDQRLKRLERKAGINH